MSTRQKNPESAVICTTLAILLGVGALIALPFALAIGPVVWQVYGAIGVIPFIFMAALSYEGFIGWKEK